MSLTAIGLALSLAGASIALGMALLRGLDGQIEACIWWATLGVIALPIVLIVIKLVNDVARLIADHR